jgi:hypothetical protein
MTRRTNKSNEQALPDPIMARQRTEAEKHRQMHQQSRTAQEKQLRLLHAGIRVGEIGQKFLDEQTSDKEYLKEWVKTMADYRTALRQQGKLETFWNPEGLTDQDRDAFCKAVEIFETTDVDQDRAVALLVELAAIPEFAANVSRWLCFGIRAVMDSPLWPISVDEPVSLPPPPIPPHPTELLPFDRLDSATFARFNKLAAQLLGREIVLPRQDGFDGHPHLIKEDFADLAIIVCERLPGTTLKDWWEADPIQKIALMELAWQKASTGTEEWVPATVAVDRAETAGRPITLTWLTRDAKKHGVKIRPRQLQGRHKVEVEWHSLAGYLLRRPKREGKSDEQEISRRLRDAQEKKRRECPLD